MDEVSLTAEDIAKFGLSLYDARLDPVGACSCEAMVRACVRACVRDDALSISG